MAANFTSRAAHRLLLIAALAVLAALLVIPRAASQETRTLALDVAMTGESFEFVPALGNPAMEDSPLARGDVLSAQGAVYAAGDVGGERIGTFYFMGVGTAEPEHFGTAANHAYVVGHFELFDQGTLAVTGVVSFFAQNSVVITGGTGSFATASGQCTTVTVDGLDHWECEVY